MNQWERGSKLLASALDLVAQKARTPQEWADHLQVFVFGRPFTFDVDFDDPRWDRIDTGPRRYVGNITASNYPRKFRGKKRVTCMPQSFDNDWKDQEAIDAADARNGWTADRVITETFGEKYPDEQMQAPVIGICGDPVDRGGRLDTPYVSLDPSGVHLFWDWAADRWLRGCRALVVLTVEDL